MFFQAWECLWQFLWPTPVDMLEWVNRRFGSWVSILNWGHLKEGIGPHSQLALARFPFSWEVLRAFEKAAGCLSFLTLASLALLVCMWRVALQWGWAALHKMRARMSILSKFTTLSIQVNYFMCSSAFVLHNSKTNIKCVWPFSLLMSVCSLYSMLQCCV